MVPFLRKEPQAPKEYLVATSVVCNCNVICIWTFRFSASLAVQENIFNVEDSPYYFSFVNNIYFIFLFCEIILKGFSSS